MSSFQPQTILVRSPNWIGDQVLSYPFFFYLRKRYPRAHIASVCVSWVEDIQFRDLVNEVIVIPSARQGTLASKFFNITRFGKDLKKDRSWDLGVSLPNSFSAAWLLYLSGAKVRRGYKKEGRGLLLNGGIPWSQASQTHRVQAYVQLLGGSHGVSRKGVDFWGVPAESEFEDGIPGELNFFDYKKSWPDAPQISPPKEPYWVLAPGSKAESRRWPIERFRKLAELVQKNTGWTGVVVGSLNETPLAEYLSTSADLKIKDLTARGSVAELAEIFKNARFTLCNESGLAHVASLCGSPVQIVCGAADPRRTKPIGPGRVQVSINPVECWPCERNICIQETDQFLQCLKGIQVESVWEEIKSGFWSETKETP